MSNGLEVKHDFVLKGDRILLSIPDEVKSSIELDENTKKELAMEQLAKLNVAVLYAVGDECKFAKQGMEVLVPLDVLQMRGIPIFVNGSVKVMLKEEHIAIVY